jgi:hypothetical protein
MTEARGKPMRATMTAVELTGTIDEQRHLQLDAPLPFNGPARVKVIVLYPLDDEPSEAEWLYTAAHNPAFASLHEPQEDIYTLDDGQPFDDDQA